MSALDVSDPRWPKGWVMASAILCSLAVAAPCAAQPWRIVDVDRSLAVADINNDLVAVGFATGGVPFVLDAFGVRLFPELRGLLSLRINNNGLVVATDFARSRIFRINIRGTGYVETSLPLATRNFVTRLTDSGIALIDSDARPGVIADYVWDGSRLVSVFEYGVEPPMTVSDVGEDGTVGGWDSGRPFFKRLGQPLLRPWADGAVLLSGPAGHVVGYDSTGLVMREPNGTLRPAVPWSRCNPANALSINRTGDLVGACGKPGRLHSEAHLFRQGGIVNLNDHFNVPGEYLSLATRITDTGVILANVYSEPVPGGPVFGEFRRNVLLVPPEAEIPGRLRANVTGRTVTVSWDPSAFALEYVVHAGSEPGLTDVYVGSVGTALAITGAVPPGRYFVRVRARTAAGLSASSTELEVHVP